MILLDTKSYRIERFNNTPLPVALDYKEPQGNGHICLVNVGWFRCYEHALTAMNQDFLSRHDSEATRNVASATPNVAPAQA